MSTHTHTMKTTLLTTISATMLALSLGGGAARAEAKRSPEATATRAEIQKMIGFVPAPFSAMPDNLLPGAWEEFKTIQVMDGALPCKVKEIISLSVASQLPSPAMVYGHTQIAKAAGATSAEITDGVAMAALARHWSTFLNGLQLDEKTFRSEIAKVVDGAKKAAAAGGGPAPTPINVVDAKTALQDIKSSMGFVPEFMTKFPAQGLAGAWRGMRDVELNPTTALSGKVKSLVSLAVASQIPCRYCVVADTEFAKLDGATDKEIAEAIVVAGIARENATLMTGLGVDEAGYKRDMDRVAKGVRMMTSAAGKTAMTNVK